MGAELSESGPFFLGDWLVEPQLNKISKQGLETNLEPLVMAVLNCLALKHPQVVSKDALIDAAWQGRAVSDNAVSRVITDLRRALGDVARAPIYIETISRKGYRLVAPLSRGVTSPLVHSEPISRTAEATASMVGFCGPRKRRLAGHVGLWLAGLLAMAAALLIFFWPKRVAFEAIQAAYVAPLTSRKGIETSPLFSGDGHYLIYHHFEIASPAQSRLFVKDLGNGREKPFTDENEQPASPALAHGSASIAYFDHAGKRSRIVLRTLHYDSLTAGPAKMIAELGVHEPRARLAFSGDDRRLIFSQRAGSKSPFQIFSVWLSTGQMSQHTLGRQGGYGDYDFAVRPQGDEIALLRSNHWNAARVVLHNVNTGRERQLMQQPVLYRDIAWRGPDQLLLSSEHGLELMDFQKPSTKKVYGIPRHGSHVAIRPGSGEFALVALQADRDIWRVLLDKQQNEIRREPWVTANRLDFLPRLNRVNHQLAFISQRSGQQEVWLTNSKRRQTAVQASHFEEKLRIKDMLWSPDGRFLLLWTVQWQFYLLETGPGHIQKLDVKYGGMPGWNHDGTKVFFTSDEEEGWQLWQYDLASGKRARITRDGGYVARVGADGLFLLKYYQPGIWFRQNRAGPFKQLSTSADARFWQSWQTASGAIYYPWRREAQQGVFRLDPNHPEPHLVFELESPEHSHFTLDEAASVIFYDKIVRKETDIVLYDRLRK